MLHREGSHAAYYLMTAPAFLLLLLFSYLPLRGLVIAFQDYSPRLGYVGMLSCAATASLAAIG